MSGKGNFNDNGIVALTSPQIAILKQREKINQKKINEKYKNNDQHSDFVNNDKNRDDNNNLLKNGKYLLSRYQQGENTRYLNSPTALTWKYGKSYRNLYATNNDKI